MKCLKTICVALAVLTLSGCVTTTPSLNINEPSAVSTAVTFKRDDFTKVLHYTGPNIWIDGLSRAFIRAWRHDRTGEFLYQIYVTDSYYSTDWRFYESTYDSDGKRLDTAVISREVKSCSGSVCYYEENLGLNVSQEYLEKNKLSGIRFKIMGKSGEKIFSIPSGYIQGFLYVAK